MAVAAKLAPVAPLIVPCQVPASIGISAAVMALTVPPLLKGLVVLQPASAHATEATTAMPPIHDFPIPPSRSPAQRPCDAPFSALVVAASARGEWYGAP